MTRQEMENIAIIARNNFIVHNLPNAYNGYKIIRGKLFSISNYNQTNEIHLNEVAKFINHAIDSTLSSETIISVVGADKYKEIVRLFIRGLVQK